MVAEVRKSRRKRTPAEQALGGGYGGVVPPVAHRFQNGVSGNPSGRPSAGLVVQENWNLMAGWTRPELEAVIADQDAPIAKVAAARAWLHAACIDLNNGGSPIAGADLERIIVHTEGKAREALDVTSNGETVSLLPIRLDGDKEL